MPTTDAQLASLSENQRLVLESWLVEFDLSWDEDGLAKWVRRLPPRRDPLRQAALVEMVKIDLERRWQRGQRAKLEAYVKVLPELGAPDQLPADLVLAEYDARQQCGARADADEFARRFPQHADELRRVVAHPSDMAVESDKLRTQETWKDRHEETEGTSTPDLRTPVPGGLARDAVALPEWFGRYRILRELGRGAMGAVYLAHDSQLDRQVALKVPQFTAEDGPEVRQRFLSEARAAATIEHPNVCPVYDVGEVNGTLYLTMAYVQGVSLAQLQVGATPLPERQAASLVRQLTVALQAAHERGIIHRDLKPSNIIINPRGEPVILDFGLARRLRQDEARLTRSGQPLGTPAYMSPEQVAGAIGVMGPGCDIYALGVILYQLLTGRLPFEGSMAEVLGQIVTQQPPAPSKYRAGLDPRLDAVCLKALSKRVPDRYGSMRDLGAALADYLRSGPPPAANPIDRAVAATTSVGRGARPRPAWLGRKRLLLAAGGLAFAGVMAVVLLASVIIWTTSSRGTIRIELEGPRAGVEVKVDGAPVDSAGTEEPLQLRPGEHHLLVTGEQIQPVSTSFTVVRGDNPVLRVRLEPRADDPDSKPSPGARGRRHHDDDDWDDD
jgi:hypothetical protein